MNLRILKTEVLSCDFPGIRNLFSPIDLSGLCNLTGLNSLYSPISLKNFLILMIWSSMAQKWPIIVIFCGMDNQKSKFLLIHGIFSVRGCWGQSRLLFWKLDDESQISKTQDHTDTFKHNLTSIFLSVRPKLLLTFQYEIPCILLYYLPMKSKQLTTPNNFLFFTSQQIKWLNFYFMTIQFLDCFWNYPLEVQMKQTDKSIPNYLPM